MINLRCTWNKEKYQELLNYLDSLKDIKYRDFHKKIISCDNIIGVKTNELKKIAKEISLGDYNSFFENNKSSLYETIMIEGYIIGYLKLNLESIIPLIDNYLLKVNNWAHVDSFVSNLKIFKKEDKKGFIYAKKLIHSKKTFIKRCGIIILLNYYLHDKYIDKVLDIVSKVKSDDYYVKMGISWLLSISYIKYKEKTLVYLVNLKDDFTYNKTLTKIIESRRISENEKKFIKSLKRENKKIKKLIKQNV